MLKVKVFHNAPEELLELKIKNWLDKETEEIGIVDIVSTSQSQDREYVTLTIFYKQVNLK